MCWQKNPYPSINLLGSGNGSAKFSIKRLIALIAARKLDCLLASRLCMWASFFSELCARDLARVGRSNDGTLLHLEWTVFTIPEYEIESRTCNATLLCCMQIMAETSVYDNVFGCG